MSDDEPIPSLLAKTFAGLSQLHARFRLPPADEAYWAEVRENYLKWNGSMSDDDEPIPSLAAALTEIRRLRARIAELEAFIAAMPTDDAAELQLHKALARIAELEANAAITFGTLEQPTPDEPAVITHGHPPSAPPHNE